jgi:hypothetical protein
MSDQPHREEGGQPARDPHTFTQEVQHANVAARVPEKVGRGAFSNGILVLQGSSEFVLDFVLRMSQPHQVVARVAVPLSLMPGLINILRENLDNYRQAFGPPPALPAGQRPANPPSVEEIYHSLKLPEEVAGGVYANAALVSHSAAEFCLDFIANFYPRATVSARVFLSAANAPVLLNSLVQAWQAHEAKLQQRQPPKRPAE